MARAPTPMTDEELTRILRAEEAAATDYQTGTLSPIREKANNYYDRQPYGDEQLSVSRVVTSEFYDTVESIMPGMMEVFAGSDQVARFSPSAEGQEVYADEATEYVTHCLMQKNNGFRLLHDSIKSGMMSRLGGCAVDLEDFEETITKPAEHITQDAIDLIMAEASAKGATLAMALTEDPLPPPAMPIPGAMPGVDPAADQALPVPVPPQTFSGTISITHKRKRVVVDGLPAEDILFSPTAHDQDKCSFIGYLKKSTASDLVKLGLTQDEVDELHADRPQSTEETQRTDGAITGQSEQRDREGDSERPLWLVVCYVKADANGDGVSETLRVVYAHGGGDVAKIIEKAEWKDLPAVALATPILMPHTIVGRSLFDQTEDLQRIGSTVTRGLLNNIYMVNAPRPVVSDKVNLATLLDWAPNSPIRLLAGADPSQNHVNFLKTPSIMGDALTALEYFATVRENRTGTSRANQGLQADSLNKTKGGLQMLMSAGAARQKLMARVQAETFVARLYRLVYQAVKRAETGPVKYWTGTTWKQVDPSKWPAVMDLTVNVSSGNSQQEVEQLMLMAGVQEKLIALQGGKANGPYIYPEHVANLSQAIASKLGYRTPGMFTAPREQVAQQPAQQQTEQPQMPPEIMVAQAQIKILQDAATVETQIKREKAAADVETAREKARSDMAIAAFKARQWAEIERYKVGLKADLGAQELRIDATLEAIGRANQPPPAPSTDTTQ